MSSTGSFVTTGRLEKARGLLEARGYKFVDILEPTPQDDDQELLFLHVERVEQHTPLSAAPQKPIMR